MAIVTISRQVGSLGEEIARELSAVTGYRLAGVGEFRETASRYDPEFAEKLRRFEQEEGPGFFERLFFSTPVYLSLYEAVVLELASQHRVIIMGRGAQVVLRDVRQVYRVRVVAPMHQRVLHMRQVHGMSTDEALEYIRKHDHRREGLVRQVYVQDPQDWTLYDMILNTGRLDASAGAAIVRKAMDEVIRVQPMEETVESLKAQALGKRVEARLRRQVNPTRDIEVRGEIGGVVTLTGRLPSEDDRRAAIKIAQSFDGVTKVVDDLKYSVFGYGY